MKRIRKPIFLPFLMVGIAFLCLGISGAQRGAFIGIGVTFIVIGLTFFRRSRKQVEVES